MNIETVKCEKRDVKTKASVIRKSGRIPACLYGGTDSQNFSTTLSEVKNLIYTPEFKLASIDLDGKQTKCLVKNVQFHPTTDEILHIDFLSVEEGRKIKVEVPVTFKGISPGVKAGGKLMQSMRKVKIKVDPKHLVNHLTIDISHLKLAMAVRVKDIEVNENIEIMANPNIPVAVIEVPRALKSAAAAETAVKDKAAAKPKA